MTFERDGVRLHYEVLGEGEPLLWLHGFMGAGADWQYIFDRPPDGFRLIAPDLRGHGASANPSSGFSFKEAAADVSALLGHLNVDRVNAIGASGGGVVLLHMATAAPASVSSMVVVSAPPYFPAQARALQRQMSAAIFGATEMELMRKRHQGGDTQIERLFAWGRAMADSYDDVSFTPPCLSTIAADTLVVFGDRDPLYPLSLAFELHAGIPKSHLWIVPNGGHLPIFGSDAPRFAETALSFLRRAWA